MSVYLALSAGFSPHRAKPALIVPGAEALSYAQLDQRSARFASVLDNAGVAPDGVVAVQADKSADLLALYLAVLRSGRTFLPLNPTYTDEEVDYYTRDARAAALVCTPGRESRLAPIAIAAGARAVLTLDEGDGRGSLQVRGDATPFRSSNEEVADVPLDRPAVLLYTSGTTGKPKGAPLTHHNVIAMIESLREAWAWSAEDVLLHALPLFHIHGLLVAATVGMRAGATIILVPRFDVESTLEWLPRATLFMGVPTMYHRLGQDERLTPQVCQRARLFVSGSAPLSVPDFERFRHRTGHAILERYGMTETGMITSNPLVGARKPGAVGIPLPGVRVRLADPETFQEPSEGEVGEIWVQGPNVFEGYLRRPDANAEAFVDGWFRTGDLAYRDPDGYYFIVGRARDVVISGGLNVYPAEVENVLNAVPGVEESAVIGLPDEDLGERVTAVVVRSGDLAPQAIIAEARKHLAPYKCPRSVEFVTALPRNAMGKVDKEALRRQLA